MAYDTLYFRKAYLSVDGNREIAATNLSMTVTNAAGIRKTDAAVGAFDDTSPSDVEGTVTVSPYTTGGIDYLTWIATPGERLHRVRFSTADYVVEALVSFSSASETQPQDPAGHDRQVNFKGVLQLLRRVVH